MDAHEEFTNWAVDQGVKINGIKPHKFEGRGLGIISTKRLQPHTTILTIPYTTLRTAHTVPRHLQTALSHTPITIHGLLALDLTLSLSTQNPHFAPWHLVLPTPLSFTVSMPLCWPPSLQSLLPSDSLSLLKNQQRKLKVDWGEVKKVFKEVKEEEYLYAWMLVNTRTFYFVEPKAKKGDVPRNRDDCMALNPFADYFNHASAPDPSNPNSPTPCSVELTSTSYTITTVTSHPANTELYISYGPHTSSFLLTEYGFLPPSPLSAIPTPFPKNTHDALPLDLYILPLFTPSQTKVLKEHHFYGEYVLDREGICYRTLVSLLLLLMPRKRWLNLVSGTSDEDAYSTEFHDSVNKVLAKALRAYKRDAKTKLKEIKALGENEGLAEQRETLKERWGQILQLIEAQIERMG